MSRKKNHNREWPLTELNAQKDGTWDVMQRGRMTDLEWLLSSNVLFLDN